MYHLDPATCQVLGRGLRRPEGVVVGADGHVWASDQAACVAEVLGPGDLRRLGRAGGEPNGIAFTEDGRLIVANFENGHVDVLDPRSGEHTTLLECVDGEPLVCTNHVVVDSCGAIWGTCSTRRTAFMEALVDGVADGFIFRIDPEGVASIVAGEVGFPNGLALDADERFLYCCRSARVDVVRYPIIDGTRLGPEEPYGPTLGERSDTEWGESALDAVFGAGPDRKPATPEDADWSVLARWGLTDGCAFDAEGNLWVTVATKNQLVVITPSGEAHVALEDRSGGFVRLPTNLAWGGPDLKDLYVASSATPFILKLPAPVPGMPLVHQR